MNETYKGYTIKLEHDDLDDSPRDWDNLGRMLCFHGRYDLGDKHDVTSDDFTGWKEVETYLKNKLYAVVIAPLYLYDHSGLRIKIGSFHGLLPQGHAEFDSGQIGFIYITKDDLKKEFNKQRISKKLLAKAEKILESEVEVYDQYVSGDVYYFSIEDEEGNHIDSLGGLYGYEYALEQAQEAIDYHIESERKTKQAKTKQLIKSNVPLIYRT